MSTTTSITLTGMVTAVAAALIRLLKFLGQVWDSLETTRKEKKISENEDKLKDNIENGTIGDIQDTITNLKKSRKDLKKK